MNVRDQLAKDIAMVRREARAGRLKWTYDDVKSLIQPYPRRKADSVFENLGDQHQMDEGESHTKMMRPQLRTRTLNPIGQSGMSPQQRGQRAQRMPQ